MGTLLRTQEFAERLFFPRPDRSLPPPGARDLFVDVAPGVRLHTRWYDSPGAVAAMLHFHGNGEVVADYDALAPRFARAGVTLLATDYRGYGRSQGRPLLTTCLEDAHRLLAAARHHLPQPLPLVVMGRSLGALCAAELAGSPPPSVAGVAGVVIESGAGNLQAMAARRGYSEEVVSEDDLATFCPLRKHGRSHLPLLVLHGASDGVIPPQDAEATFAASGAADKRLVLIPGRGHNDLMAEPRYWSAIAEFVTHIARA